MQKINKSWFRDKLAEKQISQRQLAKRIGIDPAAVSYMLSGRRKMTMDDANNIAREICVSVVDVMKHAGLSVNASNIGTTIYDPTYFDEVSKKVLVALCQTQIGARAASADHYQGPPLYEIAEELVNAAITIASNMEYERSRYIKTRTRNGA